MPGTGPYEHSQVSPVVRAPSGKRRPDDLGSLSAAVTVRRVGGGR
jgi:hypothetical protein